MRILKQNVTLRRAVHPRACITTRSDEDTETGSDVDTAKRAGHACITTRSDEDTETESIHAPGDD